MYLVIVESLDIVDKTWETNFLLNKFSCNSGFSCFSQIFNSEHFFEHPLGADRYKMIKNKLILSIPSQVDTQII